jgi:hypothetical protein
MRKKRTIYFNDARHYYLFVFEPPMRLEDAWRPVDEVAGTAIDTFAYGVERGDGVFYPSQWSMRFGADMKPFQQAAYWRVWHNMQSLIDRGLDPLRVLVDRAHEMNMAFIASLRMPSFGGMNPSWAIASGGQGLALKDVREHQFRVLEELAVRYEVDGVELDFSLPGGARNLRAQDAESVTPELTDYVERIAEMIRSKTGRPCALGARVYPSEALNLAEGLDIKVWLGRRCLDYLVPLHYGYMIQDPEMPVEWLVNAAQGTDTAVYGFIQPYARDPGNGRDPTIWPLSEQIRATAANFWAKGVDGLYTWFLRWPFGDTERRILTELGDPEQTTLQDKRYVLPSRQSAYPDLPYPAALPVEIAASEAGKPFTVTFHLADRFDRDKSRIREVRLRIRIQELVSADRLSFHLNNRSLQEEFCVRDYGDVMAPYTGQWLEFHLERIWPLQGENTLTVTLESRPDDLQSALTIAEMEIIVRYGSFPTTGRVIEQ